MNQKLKWAFFTTVFRLFFVSNLPLWGDVSVVNGTLKAKGDTFVTIKVSETGIFKTGSSQTFYLHPKTKIIMSGSEAPLVLDSLLMGDTLQVTLGKTEKTKDNKWIQYANKIVVLSTRRSKPKKEK